MDVLTSRQHPLCKLVRSLHQARNRRRQQRFVIEGANAVSGALRARWPLETLLVPPDEIGHEWFNLAQSSGLEARFVEEDLLTYLSEAQSAPDVIAIAKIAPAQEGDFSGLSVWLDGVSDPGNAGTLIRAADAAGAGAVFSSSHSADLFSPKTVRASAGSLFSFPHLAVDGAAPEAILQVLAVQHIPIIAAQAHDGENCFQFRWPSRCALVLGHETRGISPLVAASATARVTIPIYGRAESLNVAMAGTILMYAWRQAMAQI